MCCPNDTVPPGDRLDKWDRKFDTARVKDILDGEKPTMKTRAGVAFTELAAVENATKAVLNSAGISVAQTANYLNFARQVWKTDGTYEGETLRVAVEDHITKWVSRGLTRSVLERIRDEVFTIGPPSSP